MSKEIKIISVDFYDDEIYKIEFLDVNMTSLTDLTIGTKKNLHKLKNQLFMLDKGEQIIGMKIIETRI